MKIVREFKKFVLRGNVIDLSIGFTVGAAFTSIAKSLVDDIIMPPVGYLLGSVDFSQLYLLLKPGNPLPPYDTLAAAKAAGAITINYGIFINNVIALFFVALAMFAIIKMVNRFDFRLEEQFGTKKRDDGQPTDKKCPFCLSTISFNATRCAHCTSQLPPLSQKKTK